MIAKKFRLDRKRVGQIMASGTASYLPLFVVKSLKNSKPFPRFAVLISTKLAKNATARNRFRRRTYEAVRRHLLIDMKNAAEYHDYVLIGRKSLLRKKFDDIASCLSKL